MTTYGAWLTLALCSVLTAGANLLLRAGLSRGEGFPGSLADIVPWFAHMLLQPAFTLGFILYFAAALVWFKLIASEPLSLAYPLLISLTFFLVSAGAVVFFREPMSPLKIGGMAVIVLGIFLVSKA